MEKMGVVALLYLRQIANVLRAKYGVIDQNNSWRKYLSICAIQLHSRSTCKRSLNYSLLEVLTSWSEAKHSAALARVIS